MKNNKSCIILMGFMGSGKTTVGETLSTRLGIPVMDTDQMIERREGRIISEIFATDGETAFRNMETALLEELSETEMKAVISIGGGMPVRKVNRELLRKIGTVVYLRTGIETLVGRVQGDTSRPLLQTEDLHGRIVNLLGSREQIYLDTADLIIDTDDLMPGQVADEICKRIPG